jgi:hypothetical protein
MKLLLVSGVTRHDIHMYAPNINAADVTVLQQNNQHQYFASAVLRKKVKGKKN